MSAFPALSRRTLRLLGLTTLLLLAAVAAGGTYFWWQRPAAVPEIPLEGQEKEVVEKITEARVAVIKAPHSASDWGYLGKVLLANEISLDSALVCFLEAERLDPKEPRWPYFSAGLLAGEQGKPEEAVPKFERAVALAEASSEPTSAPRLWLAETLASLGRPAQAAAHFQKVLAAEANNPRAHFGLGLLAYARGDWQVCRTHLEACLGSPEARKRACINLAMVYERLGDQESADHYAKLAARAPRDFDWRDPYIAQNLHLAVRMRDRYRVVETLESQGRLAQATNNLLYLLSAYPDDYRPHLMMGRLQGQSGQLASAEVHLRKARQLAPDKIQVHYLLSLVLFREGEALQAKESESPKAKALFEESAQSARQALALKADYGYAYMSLGLALKQLQQRAAALAAFRQAVHCNPEFADNHLFLGEALADEGDLVAARRHLEQAKLLAHPNDPRPKAALEKLPAASAPKAK
jgi:tetratricopeptide (TPR) repeat protein